MATLARPKKRPVLPDAGSVERYAKLTREGLFKLTEAEQTWHQRYRYLQANGYLLRPRYAPGWKPSWINTNDDPLFCEDSVTLRVGSFGILGATLIKHLYGTHVVQYYQVIDATRLSDKKLVAIKSFFTDRQEMHIAQFLASVQDSRNHTVPILEILPDPTDPQRALMVMPYLRPCNDPEFSTIGDVVEFLDQTIDGLVFMHAHNIAHRDVAVANIMMDARALYPQGHHPMQIGYSPDVLHPVTPLPRAGRDVKYYYIDFGLSSRFPPGTSTLVIGDVGRAYVPELSDTVPYDAFKVDIFSLGDLFLQEFEQAGIKYNNVEFLAALIEPMVQKQPALRPTAELVLREWTKIRATLNESRLRWRLVPKNEAPLERVVNDTVAVAWEGVYRLKKFVAP